MSQMTAPTTLDAWVRRLGEEEFPLFAHTARSIAAMSTDDGSSTSELAQVILRDNTMTARVLKMANSVYYNPGGVRINTVSRSIVILGFDTVRNIALSIGATRRSSASTVRIASETPRVAVSRDSSYRLASSCPIRSRKSAIANGLVM